MIDVLEALALREDSEDPLIATVHQQVTTGSESVFYDDDAWGRL
jgi:hypothetical protein